jgi:hypothetical protein
VSNKRLISFGFYAGELLLIPIREPYWWIGVSSN